MKIKGLLLGLILTVFLQASAFAASVTFTFTGTSASGDSLIFTDETTGLTLTVTAYIGTKNYTNLTQSTVKETSIYGLGVDSSSYTSDSDEASNLVDNSLNITVNDATRIGMEYLCFTFSEEVTLTQLVFSSVTSSDEFALLVDGTGVLSSQIGTSSPSTYNFTGDENTGTVFVVDPYIVSSSSSDWSILSITVDYTESPSTTVPEPAGMVLMGTGLLCLTGLRKRFLRR